MRKHLRGARGVDARSSGIYFDGWQVPIPVATTCRPVVSPRTWLGSVGWRRLGLLRPDESPAPRRRRRWFAVANATAHPVDPPLARSRRAENGHNAHDQPHRW